MREIKFRGKRIVNGEWVYGYYEFLRTPLIHWMEEYRMGGMLCLAQVDPATIGQYTGLKDKNGTEIYEGDVVQNIYGDIFTVEYYGEHWYGYVLTANDGCVGHLYEYDEYEVIGNIHNGELLGGAE